MAVDFKQVCAVSGILMLGVALFAAPSGLYGQAATSGTWSLNKHGIRIVYPGRELYDSAFVERLAWAVAAQPPIAGLPPSDWLSRGVTISLAPEWIDGLDARSRAGQRLIILPLLASVDWEDDKLWRVIRHELAHIVLGAHLEFRRPARWFEEGFAEWASGEPSCEDAVRVHLTLSTADVATLDLLLLSKETQSRLTYSIYATFFEYLDEAGGGSLRGGAMMHQVKELGEEQGIAAATGVPFADILRSWRIWLLERYENFPEDQCPDQVPGV